MEITYYAETKVIEGLFGGVGILNVSEAELADGQFLWQPVLFRAVDPGTGEVLAEYARTAFAPVINELNRALRRLSYPPFWPSYERRDPMGQNPPPRAAPQLVPLLLS